MESTFKAPTDPKRANGASNRLGQRGVACHWSAESGRMSCRGRSNDQPGLVAATIDGQCSRGGGGLTKNPRVHLTGSGMLGW